MLRFCSTESVKSVPGSPQQDRARSHTGSLGESLSRMLARVVGERQGARQLLQGEDNLFKIRPVEDDSLGLTPVLTKPNPNAFVSNPSLREKEWKCENNTWAEIV